MSGVLKSALAKRAQGQKPSALHAISASLAAGMTVAVLTYRLMRS